MNHKGSAIVFVLIIIVLAALVAAGIWYYVTYSSRQTGPTSAPSATTANTMTATSIMTDLRQTLVQQGYTFDSSNSQPFADVPLWWISQNHTAINIPTSNIFNVIITHSEQNSYETTSTIAAAPEIKKFVNFVTNYMSSQGLSLQSDEDGGANYTQSYASDTKRCKLTVFDPNLGVDEFPPYEYLGTIACADNQEYQAAYDAQNPLLLAIAAFINNGTNPHAQDIFVIYVSSVCSKDPTITAVETYDISSPSTNYYFLKNVNGSWNHQTGAECGRF